MDGALMKPMLDCVEVVRGTGGELIVTSKKTEHGRLVISVSDRGVGVPVTDVERVFEAFFTTTPQGTGSGLSVRRRMIASHGDHLPTNANARRRTIVQFSLGSTNLSTRHAATDESPRTESDNVLVRSG